MGKSLELDLDLAVARSRARCLAEIQRVAPALVVRPRIPGLYYDREGSDAVWV